MFNNRDVELTRSYQTLLQVLAGIPEPVRLLPFLAPTLTVFFPGRSPLTANADQISNELANIRLPWVNPSIYRIESEHFVQLTESQILQSNNFERIENGKVNDHHKCNNTIIWEIIDGKWLVRFFQTTGCEVSEEPGKKILSKQRAPDDVKNTGKLLLKKTRQICDLNLELDKLKKETREIEERYITLFNNTTDGIIIADWKKHNFKLANDTICKMLEYTPDQLEGKWFSDIIPSDDLQPSLKKILLQSDANIAVAEDIPLLTRSSKILFFNVVSKMTKIKGESFLVSLFRDISTEKDALVQWKKSDEARKASDAKNLFLANLSHEIRTPVTSIFGMSDILSRTQLDQTQKGYLDIIKGSSRILLNHINNILDISGIEAGKLTVKKDQFLLSDVFDNIRILTHTAMLEKNNQMVFEIGSNAPNQVFSDRMRFEQILLNLVNNAINFTQNGKITIRVTTEEKAPDQVRISVTDTGTGISKEDQEKIFERFQQLDNAKAKTELGFGPGLFICQQLVSLLDGKIGVNSAPGKGSTFWFSFRTEIVAPSLLPSNESEYDDETPLNFNVLLVDDKRVNLQVISIMLQAANCRIDTALNGLEALEKFDPAKHHIILMDIMMPVMDGITSMKELRKKHQKLPPIIAITANVMAGDKEKYISEGFDAYIPKPLTMQKLISELRGLGVMR